MKLDLYQQSGEKKGTVNVSEVMFHSPVNEELIRLSVLRHLANSRQANAHVKTRAEVRGGGKKPWKQKGTGRARFGSTRNPIWRGGGIAFGPRNVRNFTLGMNKKARRSALFGVLSKKAADGEVFVLDEFKGSSPKTKAFADLLKKLPKARSLLIITGDKNGTLEKSARNLVRVKLATVGYLNPYDALNHEKIMFMESALKKAEELFLS